MNYIIEHSTNGTVKTIADQFETAKFETVKEAKTFIKDIMKFASLYGYNFEVKSWFQVKEVSFNESWGENEYKSVGNKIIVK